MTAEEFLKQLDTCLQYLPKAEKENAMSYYREYLEEADDADKAAENLGSPQSVAEKIMLEEHQKEFAVPEQKSVSAGNILFSVILLIFTSPFWFAVGMIWLALLFSMGVTVLSLVFSAVLAPVQGISYLMNGFIGYGMWDIGSGLLCAGLAMLLWKPFLIWSISLTKWLWNRVTHILNALFRKEQTA